MKIAFIGALILLIGTILTQIVFLVLKATGTIDWTWFQTLLPIIIGFCVYLIGVLCLFAGIGISFLNIKSFRP